MPTSRVTDKVVHRSLHSLDGFLSFEVCIYSFLFYPLGFSPPCLGACRVLARGCVCACRRVLVRACRCVHACVCVCTRACRAAPLLPSPCTAAVTPLQPHPIPGIPGHAGSSGCGTEPLTVCYPTRSIHPQKHFAASWCRVGRGQQERRAPALVASPLGVFSAHRAGSVHSERGWHCPEGALRAGSPQAVTSFVPGTISVAQAGDGHCWCGCW